MKTTIGIICWIVMWVLFGAVMGEAGWHDCETGALIGFAWPAVTALVYLIYKDDKDEEPMVAGGVVEGIIDSLMD